jgi:cytochrome bd-type quinol oxidase subunit 2
MSSELVTLFALLVGYLAIAVGATFVVWRTTRHISSRRLRLALRAVALAFLFAPGAVACGGASIVPFSLVVVGDVIGLIAPNGCGPYAPFNLVSFLPVLAVVALVLYLLERRRSRVDAL